MYEAERVEMVLAFHPPFARQVRSSLMGLVSEVDQLEPLDTNVGKYGRFYISN